MDRATAAKIIADIDALPVPGGTLGDVFDIFTRHGVDPLVATRIILKAYHAERASKNERIR